MEEIIFFIILACLVLLLGLIGFFISISVKGKVALLSARLAEVERLLLSLQQDGLAQFVPLSQRPETQSSHPAQTEQDQEPDIGTELAETDQDEDRLVAATIHEETKQYSEDPTQPAEAISSSTMEPTMGLEERLGTRWAVWIGGIALALGGIFVVRYSIERGWFGPAARIAFGALFSLALIACGEWLRRKEMSKTVIGIPSAHIPSIITAAGTTSAFATVYAAYALYYFIGPATAFILLGLVAIATMLAAALHGPALAGLGLIASLVAPILVSTGSARFWPVVVYLIFVVGSAYGLARLRWWRWLALSGAGGALLWGGIFLFGQRGDISPAIGHVILQTAMAAAIFVVAPYHTRRRAEEPSDTTACLILTLFGVLGILIAAEPLAGAFRIPLSSAIAFGFLTLSWRYRQAVPMVATSVLICFGTLLFWPYLNAVSNDPLQALAVDPVERENLPAFLSFAIASGIVLATAGYFKIGRDYTVHWRESLWFMASATAGPLALLILCYWRVTAFDHSLPFAATAAAIAVVFTVATSRLRQLPAGKETDTPSLAVAAAASAAVAFLALGLTMALDMGVLTVSLALTALGVAVISEKIAVPILRYLVAALGLIVLGRLIWNPMVVPGGDVGSMPIFNWLLWGYGVPAACFLISARILERRARDRVIRLTEGLGFVCATFLVFFEIRHLITGSILRSTTSLAEAGLLATASLSFAILMTHLRQRGDERFYDRAADIYRILSLCAVVMTLLPENPYLGAGIVTGGPVLNDLLPGYLLPGLLAAGLAWRSVGRTSQKVLYLTAATALALLTLYILLQIRLLFHLHIWFESGIRGSRIDYWVGTGQTEQWCYSLALLAIGLLLLGIGLVRDMLSARIAALVYLAAVTAKVFIFDLANLAGLIRGLSFIGLGIVMVAIGYAYQNSILAKRGRQQTVEDPAQPSE